MAFTRKSELILLCTLLLQLGVKAQPGFKAGFKTYTPTAIIHEHIYRYVPTDSTRLYLLDSNKTFVTADSTVVMTEAYKDKAQWKTVRYFNSKRQQVKLEEYKDEALQEVNEWRYDEKNRKTHHFRDNRVNGSLYRKQYDYTIDKKSGETVVTECSFFNNKIEFYTRMYYDKNNVLYKEVRMNDNNKDIVHVETFTYGENGKVKERSVYFPEFKVTKKFPEPAGECPLKCTALLPAGVADKFNPATKTGYIKRVLFKNAAKINDPDCKEYEYTFSNNTNCAVTVTASKAHKLVKFRYKEKL